MLDCLDLPDILQPGILGVIASFRPANEVLFNLRLINKAAAEQLTAFCSAKLSQPSPSHVFAARWGSPEAVRPLTLAQRKRLLCLTAASGSVENLKVAIDAAGVDPFPEVSEAAAAAGHLTVIQYLMDASWPLCEKLLDLAASGGHLPLCQWILDVRPDGTDYSLQSAVSGAARGGHIRLLNWLEGQWRRRWGSLAAVTRATYNWYSLAAVGAAYGCDMATFQRLYAGWVQAEELRSLKEGMQSSTFLNAATSPTPDWRAKVEWLEAQGVQPCPTACQVAASCSDGAERLAWMRERGYPVTIAAVRKAAAAGNVAALRYLLVEVAERPDAGSLSQTGLEVVAAGHLTALQLLHSVLSPAVDFATVWDVPSMARAASTEGHMAVVEWLAEAFEFPALKPGPTIFGSAAKSGNLELMAWLRERGCEWDAATVSCAAGSGCSDAVQWLVDRGCAFQDDGGPYLAAASNVDLRMLRDLRRMGCPWGPPGRVFTGCFSVIELGDLIDGPNFVPSLEAVLQFLLEEGCPVDWDEALEAAWDMQPVEHIAEWLEEERWRRGEAPDEGGTSDEGDVSDKSNVLDEGNVS